MAQSYHPARSDWGRWQGIRLLCVPQVDRREGEDQGRQEAEEACNLRPGHHQQEDVQHGPHADSRPHFRLHDRKLRQASPLLREEPGFRHLCFHQGNADGRGQAGDRGGVRQGCRGQRHGGALHSRTQRSPGLQELAQVHGLHDPGTGQEGIHGQSSPGSSQHPRQVQQVRGPGLHRSGEDHGILEGRRDRQDRRDLPEGPRSHPGHVQVLRGGEVQGQRRGRRWVSAPQGQVRRQAQARGEEGRVIISATE